MLKCSLSFRPGYLLVGTRTTGQIKELFNSSQHDKTDMETMSESMFTEGERLNFLHINWVNNFNVKRCLKVLLKKKISSVGQQRLAFMEEKPQAKNWFSIVLKKHIQSCWIVNNNSFLFLFRLCKKSLILFTQ